MIISGKNVAAEIRSEIKQNLADLRRPRKPGLAFVLVGEHPPSQTYVNMKKQACKEVGIESYDIHYPATTSESDLIKKIQTLNADPSIDGILVQLPLPPPINSQKVTSSVDPEKDVDGFHPVNMGKLLLGWSDGFLPCTPLGIKTLLERSQIPVEGRHVVIVGRSNIVGKPLAGLLMQKSPHANATVTIVHSHTQNLAALTRQADILIAAVGRPCFITSEMVREGAVVVDVGINRVEDPLAPSGYRIVGDVDFDPVHEKCAAITPVPGGIGPMTVTMLLHNTFLSFLRKT